MRQVRHQEKPATSVGNMKLDPKMHYVRVEKESARSDYVAPIEEMLHQGYSIVSEDRAVTGHSCSLSLTTWQAVSVRSRMVWLKYCWRRLTS